MVTAGVCSTGLLALTAAAGEIHKAWATFGRVTGAKEAAPNFRMTDNLALGLPPIYNTPLRTISSEVGHVTRHRPPSNS
jgi:hypothetical protein